MFVMCVEKEQSLSSVTPKNFCNFELSILSPFLPFNSSLASKALAPESHIRSVFESFTFITLSSALLQLYFLAYLVLVEVGLAIKRTRNLSSERTRAQCLYSRHAERALLIFQLTHRMLLSNIQFRSYHALPDRYCMRMRGDSSAILCTSFG